MYGIRVVFAIIFASIISFGLWYLVGWFISNESNIFIWPFYGKIIYLFFAFITFNGTVSEILKD
jgi:hypothetical protein